MPETIDLWRLVQQFFFGAGIGVVFAWLVWKFMDWITEPRPRPKIKAEDAGDFVRPTMVNFSPENWKDLTIHKLDGEWR